MSKQIINSPENIRQLLMQSAVAVLEGNLAAREANAIAQLTGEIHKSLKMQYIDQILNGKDALRSDQIIEVISHAK